MRSALAQMVPAGVFAALSVRAGATPRCTCMRVRCRADQNALDAQIKAMGLNQIICACYEQSQAGAKGYAQGFESPLRPTHGAPHSYYDRLVGWLVGRAPCAVRLWCI